LSISVFISHAGPDSPVALRVAGELKAKGLNVAIDAEQLRQGDQFLRFMEDGLSRSDYCLLLWSKATTSGKWVAIEWEAALYRAIEESRRFLLIGRLDDEPLPALLGPRIRADLFPDLYPGLNDLFRVWSEDAAARAASGRPVANGTARLTEDTNGVTVYLTSELFGLTQPLRLDLDLPAGVHLDRVISGLGLPRRLHHQNVMGTEFAYRLMYDDARLDRARSLAAQGVREGAVLWLEVEMRPFAAGEPISGDLSTATYRGSAGDVSATRKVLFDAVSAAGFGYASHRFTQ
jgi:TIR domain